MIQRIRLPAPNAGGMSLILVGEGPSCFTYPCTPKKSSFSINNWEINKRISMWPNPSEIIFSSVLLSLSVLSNSLWSHGLQHARPFCPSPTPAVYSSSCPLSRWCHSTISSSVVLFPSHLQSFSASGSFQMSLLFASGSQSIGVSASASVLPMNIQNWFPLGWTG